MPQDNSTLQEVQERLLLLQQDNSLIDFHPLLQQLHALSTVEPPYFPSVLFKAFIDLIQQMSGDINQGQSLSQVLNEAISRSGTYEQPGWDVNNVYQANGPIFQIYLNKLRDKINPPGIPVPIVLLVMNADQAKQLISGTVFRDHPELHDGFQQFRALLEGGGVTDWPLRYQATPEEWQPFSATEGAENIEQLVKFALDRVEDYQEPLIPHFVDVSILNEDRNRAELWRLRNNGCIVIIDIISIRHPTILYAFQRSLLDIFPKTLVARIAPTHSVLEIVQEMTIVVEMHIDLEFTKRFRVDYDPKCVEVSDDFELRRWLIGQTRELLPTKTRAKAGIREYQYKGISAEA
jgi:hypothetical protein